MQGGPLGRMSRSAAVDGAGSAPTKVAASGKLSSSAASRNTASPLGVGVTRAYATITEALPGTTTETCPGRSLGFGFGRGREASERGERERERKQAALALAPPPPDNRPYRGMWSRPARDRGGRRRRALRPLRSCPCAWGPGGSKHRKDLAKMALTPKRGGRSDEGSYSRLIDVCITQL